MTEEETKALFVIDKPKCCLGCPCGTIDNDKRRLRNKKHGLCYVECNIEHKETIIYDTGENTLPNWCPSRSLPKRIAERNEEAIDNKKRMIMTWEKGWNACLDEITGETE